MLPPEEDGGEWTDLGALWVAKSGNGYSGMLQDNIKVVVEAPNNTNQSTDEDD